MELAYFFKPVDQSLLPRKFALDHDNMTDIIDIHIGSFPNWERADVVIIGCVEDRASRGQTGAALAADIIRRHLYALGIPKSDMKIADLGNLIPKDNPREYYDGIALAMGELLKAKKTVLLLGGSQDISYGQYMAYGELARQVEYVAIDSQLDVLDSDFGVTNNSFNHRIIAHSPNYLFNFTNLGYQSYFVPVSERERIKNLHFNAVRLGLLKNNIKEAEPYFRMADLISVDMSALRSSDAPGTTKPCPAGFSLEEACQLMRYAGMSNKVSSIALTEIQPLKDFNEQASLSAALMAWYFLEGYYNRRIEDPSDKSHMVKYTASLNGGVHEIVFYKNERSERWWMEVPYPDTLKKENDRTMMIPCSESDYKLAQQDEVPDKWWLTHYKLR